MKCTTEDNKHEWGKWKLCYLDKGDTLAEQCSQPTYYRRECKKCRWVERENR